jgi:hypothetical protein
MKYILNKIKQKYLLLVNDKDLLHIFLLHLLLIALHFYEYKTRGIEYFWYLRAGGCGVIALCIFLFGRKGLSYVLLIFSCSLVYVNMFYNYATIFFILIAIDCHRCKSKIE